MKARTLLAAGTMAFMIAGSVLAEEGVSSAPQTSSEAPATPEVRTSKRSKPRTRKKGSAPREKETEGTEALDRFEADTVIKSQYHLDGKQLEVDPD